MGGCHRETGGLRWGRSHGGGWNATWPFAQLRVTPEQITIQLNVLGVVRRTFTVAAGDLRQLEFVFVPRAGGIWGGLVLLHCDPSQPAALIFWTFKPRTLKGALNRLGYRPIGP
jgi:hypothetical protein